MNGNTGSSQIVNPSRIDVKNERPDVTDKQKLHIKFDASQGNAMSVDVEEHFHVSAFSDHIDRKSWAELESRISRNMDRILQIFSESNAKATFFTLGWIAERAPGIVRKIIGEGHEIASHGYDHTRVSAQTAEQFRNDVLCTKNILEDIGGVRVEGYRAPSFSITEKTMWAYDVLKEAGYQYSSSIYPIQHDHYGLPAAPRFPFKCATDGLLEIPLSTTAVLGRNLQCAGGGYFRLLPSMYSHWALRRVNSTDKMPVAFYFHPWEIDPGQPRVSNIPLAARFRHYVNLNRFESRLIRLLGEFRWRRMDEIYGKAF